MSTPSSFGDDRSVAGSIMTGDTGETLDDDASVASECASEGVEAPVRKRAWNSWKRIKGVERDKRGWIIRACGIADCQYKTSMSVSMKNHKAAKHGIDVVWYSCDQDNCDYKAKRTWMIKQHKLTHNIGVVWHQCDSCDYKAKQTSHLKRHKRNMHNIDHVSKPLVVADSDTLVGVHKLTRDAAVERLRAVGVGVPRGLELLSEVVHGQLQSKPGVMWHQCDSCAYRAKHAGALTKHKRHIHNIDVVWHQCNSCEYKTKRADSLKRHTKSKHEKNLVL